jgi:hypothetical protein
MKMSKAWLVAGCAAALVSTTAPGFAQVTAKFSFDAVANCERPMMVRDFPIHGEGTGTLSTDRSASLDLNSNVEGSQRYDVKLGGKPIETPDGSATLRVRSRSSLRAVRDYPNSQLIIDIKSTGKTCTVNVQSRLKPGKRQHTFSTTMGLAYCDQPRIIRTTCNAN